MVAVTLGTAIGVDRVAASDAGVAPAAVHKGLFARVYEAVIRSQTLRAEREIARYRHLLPPDFRFHRDLWSGREEKLPFGGW
jgi:hypothetical protein